MLGAADIVPLLARHPTLAALGEEGWRICAQAMREQSLDSGQTLFLRGDPGNALYLVVQGRLRMTVTSPEGRELSVRIVLPGEMVGELAAIDEGPRTADATAAQQTRVAVLSSEALRRLIVRFPDFGFSLMRFLCGRVRDTTDQLELIALHPIEVRLARFLIVSIEGMSQRGDGRVGLKLHLSQGELAQLLGASRPKINVAFGRLETCGALSRKPGMLICDRVALLQIAEGGDLNH